MRWFLLMMLESNLGSELQIQMNRYFLNSSIYCSLTVIALYLNVQSNSKVSLPLPFERKGKENLDSLKSIRSKRVCEASSAVLCCYGNRRLSFSSRAACFFFSLSVWIFHFFKHRVYNAQRVVPFLLIIFASQVLC